MRTTAAIATTSPVLLSSVPEPMDLKAALRSAAEQDPASVTELPAYPDLAADLWSRWGNNLEGAGITHEQFLDVLAEYRQELWYWIRGHRTWSQCTEGLAGRLARRASGSGPKTPAAPGQ